LRDNHKSQTEERNTAKTQVETMQQCLLTSSKQRNGTETKKASNPADCSPHRFT
jgi:hypothetical protein